MSGYQKITLWNDVRFCTYGTLMAKGSAKALYGREQGDGGGGKEKKREGKAS